MSDYAEMVHNVKSNRYQAVLSDDKGNNLHIGRMSERALLDAVDKAVGQYKLKLMVIEKRPWIGGTCS